MQRKTKAVIVIIAVLGIFGGAFGYIKFTEQTEKPTLEEEKAVVGYVETTSEKIALEKQFPDDLPDYLLMEAIHSMSHQKVESSDYAKWGHEQITQAKVDRLLAVVKKNVVGYANQELYIEILERWSKGDFSQAIKDHNSIWELQSGNTGRAIRLLTEEEEAEYVKQHFEE